MLYVNAKYCTPLAPQAIFENLTEAERNRSVEAGDPLVLQCNLSKPEEVFWFKDEKAITPQNGINIQTDGNTKMLIIKSADFYHSGTYTCQSADDVAVFQVVIKGDVKEFNFV